MPRVEDARRTAQATARRVKRRGRRQFLHAAAGSLLAIALLVGLVSAIPSASTVRLQRQGLAALRGGDLDAARRSFAQELLREPRSTFARVGLACVFAERHQLDRALLELEVTVPRGLYLARQSACNRQTNLASMFVTVRLGSSGTMVVPADGPEAVHTFLRTLPDATTRDAGRRELSASCLAFRSGLDGAAWRYAAEAHDFHELSIGLATAFFACLGPNTRERLRCKRPYSLDQCIFARRPHDAFSADESYIFPIDRPKAFNR